MENEPIRSVDRPSEMTVIRQAPRMGEEEDPLDLPEHSMEHNLNERAYIVHPCRRGRFAVMCCFRS